MFGRKILAACAASVVADGALAIEWRYAVPRQLIDADPPPPGKPGDVGYIRTYNFIQYVSGPEWWPITAIVAVAAALIGVLLGLILCWVGNRCSKLLGRYFAVVPAATGCMLGGALGWHSRRNPPEYFFVWYPVPPSATTGRLGHLAKTFMAHLPFTTR